MGLHRSTGKRSRQTMVSHANWQAGILPKAEGRHFMGQVRGGIVSVLMLLVCSMFVNAQQTIPVTASTAVPRLINFNGTLTDVNRQPLSGIVGVTFSLYRYQQGGAPLWLETQNVRPDMTGRYSVLLGSTGSQGVPASIFVSGEAHWLDRKSTRLNSSHALTSRMPSSA